MIDRSESWTLGGRGNIGESIEEAKEKGLRFYIGKPCDKGHDMGRRNGSVRYTVNGKCVSCQKAIMREKREADIGIDKSNCEVRDKIELIKTAKELGVSVEDLM